MTTFSFSVLRHAILKPLTKSKIYHDANFVIIGGTAVDGLAAWVPFTNTD